MQQETAETIARATREEAERQARDDLDQLRRQAVEAGRERARKIIKVTMINTATGAISYNPAGRLVRDWYLHVYVNSLRHNLSQPCEVIDRQQADGAAALLERVRPEVDPERAQEAIGIGRRLAEADAAAAVARITERLHDAGTYRAVQHAPDNRFASDQLRTQVMRHWYQRCYETAVDEAVSARHPLAAVTEAEAREVARTLGSREARPIIGRDDVPLVAAPQMTPLAVVERVKQAWSDMNQNQRADWLRVAKAVATPASSVWDGVDDRQRAKLTQNYLDRRRGDSLARTTERRIEGAASEVASRMFNHSPLLASQDSRPERDLQFPRLGIEDQQPRPEVNSIAPPTRGVH